MKGPVQIPQTPITEETFKKQGWTKEFEDDEKGDEYYYTLNLPKNNKNPAAKASGIHNILLRGYCNSRSYVCKAFVNSTLTKFPSLL